MPGVGSKSYGVGAITISIQDRQMRRALLFASADEDTSPQELAKVILERWLKQGGYYAIRAVKNGASS